MFSSREFTMRSATGEKIKSIFKGIEKIPFNIMKFNKRSAMLRFIMLGRLRELYLLAPTSNLTHFLLSVPESLTRSFQ